MNEVWLAVSAVAGLVVAILAVWRIVVRATRSLRDEVKEEIRILRENDLRHLEKGIGALDARMSRSEERMMESFGQLIERVSRSEERMMESFGQLIERVTRSEERMMESLAQLSERLDRSEGRMMESLGQLGGRIDRSEERMTNSEERIMQRLDRADERNAVSFRELKDDLKDTRTELLAAILAVEGSSEPRRPVPAQ
ncbi:MAG: hypothetical protein OXU69_04105 [Gemmatimonadota bacterium]|nr:hypothetical protein [Gemmatimonadota bacterium]